MSLSGKTILITGASRGIGKAIAIRAAKDGANVVILAKTVESVPNLPGTIFTAAKEIEDAGGKALPIQCDIRFEEQVQSAIEQSVKKFGGIDIVVNNASAISLTNTHATSMKKYDLMTNINSRGTFMVTKLALPFLEKSKNPHVLVISPPVASISKGSKWFASHPAYSLSKFGMSLLVLGLSEELKSKGIAVNALWPKTLISTAALQVISTVNDLALKGRTPEIMADAAHIILTSPSKNYNGNFAIDEDVLKAANPNIDLVKYSVTPGNNNLIKDLFVDDDYVFKPPVKKSPVTESAEVKNSSLEIPGFKSSQILNNLNISLSTMEPDKREATIKNIDAIFELEIKSNSLGKIQSWTLNLINNHGGISLGKPKPEAIADKSKFVSLSMDDETFVAIGRKNLTGQKAFLLGKLKVKGNMMLATKLDTLLAVTNMNQLSSKL